jgi:RNA polymerase sigma-70 factor (ECF subfamily)
MPTGSAAPYSRRRGGCLGILRQRAGSVSVLLDMPIDAGDRDGRGLAQDARDETTRFERLLLPHLNAAYNLARWLVHGDDAAQDVVQEACLRALRFFRGFHGDDARPWFLTIVRHAAYDRLKDDGRGGATESFDEELHADDRADAPPEAALIRAADSRELRRGLEALAAPFRETIVLRELEGLSYSEIATVTGVPIGTVMSRLSRARALLKLWCREHIRREI